MSERNVTAVRGAYDAFARQDIPAVLSVMDADIVWYSPDELPFGGRFHGPEEVVGYFEALAGAFESLELVVGRVLDAGPDHVVVEGWDRVLLDGEPLEVAFLHLVTLQDGKIIGLREFSDTGKLLQRLDRAAAR